MPHYQHDCDDCTFIATFEYLGETMDAYTACDKSSWPFIARFGVDGEYMTVDVASPLYRIIRDLRDDPMTILTNLLNIREDVLEEREAILEQLGKVSMKLKSLNKEIDHWENNGVDRELLAMESEADNGVAY